ncbi:MAG: hypothetical protein JSV45_12960 [Chromatiales bacterium]|nr:MAG: hypothetical protein JSV45_12960 [Chromatiales bacterium]
MKTIVQITLAALLLAAPPGQAQDETGDAPPPRYAVEVLVFQHLDQARSTPETPVPADPFAAPEPPAEPSGAELEFVLLDPITGGPGFARLPEGELKLGNAWLRLERLDAYRPLAYLSWSQPARPRAGAQPLALRQAGAVPPGLSGQVTVYKERFLHLALDLAWQGPPTLTGNPEQPAAATTNRINESRRLRGDVVQYFDHPQFGAIAFVRELEAPEPVEAAVEPPG